MASKIEQCIDDIEQYIDSCKYKSFSTTHIICEKNELENLVSDLRKRAPEEIKQYQKIIHNREAIIADAEAKAKELIGIFYKTFCNNICIFSCNIIIL